MVKGVKVDSHISGEAGGGRGVKIQNSKVKSEGVGSREPGIVSGSLKTGGVPIGPLHHSPFTMSGDNHGIDFVHKENVFSDFDRDRLIFHMLSTQGPRIAKGDVNKDGLEDIYIGGAKEQPGALYVQTREGRFKRTNEKVFEKDKASEDTDALFFDADNDGDEDLYVCSGGSEFSANKVPDLISRLYINDGQRQLCKIKPGITVVYI